MTFLAIGEPGISKYCENCNREFLNEHVLRESGQYPELLGATERYESLPQDYSIKEDIAQQDDLQGVGDMVETRAPQQLASLKRYPSKAPSLVKMLFNEFDVCPYCHGKFIG